MLRFTRNEVDPPKLVMLSEASAREGGLRLTRTVHLGRGQHPFAFAQNDGLHAGADSFVLPAARRLSDSQ